jgi:hypothetical protein
MALLENVNVAMWAGSSNQNIFIFFKLKQIQNDAETTDLACYF